MAAAAKYYPPPSDRGNAAGAGRAVWTMKNGSRSQVEIRPICLDDEERMIKFHRGLSERSVYMRYFESKSLAARTAHRRLAQICIADPEQQTVLVAVLTDPNAVEETIIAVGRLSKLQDPKVAEVALLVSDEFQGCGLGSELLRRLIVSARGQGITEIVGEMLRDNTAMQRLLKKFGFSQKLTDPRSVRAVLNL
jgi:acetyltransferase